MVADHQSAGRGRRGRLWHSPPGLGLYVSVLLRPAAAVGEVTRWTLGAAVAACEACRALARCPAEIEWPNDLSVAGRKLGGILAELRSVGGATGEVVIGAGLNVHHGPGDWPEGLAGSAISLRQASRCGIVVEREVLAGVYLKGLGEIVSDLEQGRWDGVASRWEALAPGAHGLRVRTRGDACGVTAGLDASGALQVLAEDGRCLRVHDVESITVRED